MEEKPYIECIRKYLEDQEIGINQSQEGKYFYNPEEDSVDIPLEEAENDAYYVSICFHECGHSTGAENRLKRNGVISKTRTKVSYSYEELIAETTAKLMLEYYGIETPITLASNISYLASYLKSMVKGYTYEEILAKSLKEAELAKKFILMKGEPK